MAKEISKVKLNNTTYSLKDESARERISTLETSLASSLVFKGTLSSNSALTGLKNYKIGWTYKASAAFTNEILGKIENGDMIICITTYSNAFNASHFTVVQNNIDVMTGATSSTAGTKGMVPAPEAGKQTSFLRGDGAWVALSNATTSAAGLMSSSDKSKLDGIASEANKTTVDSALSSSSTNPVQNKVIKGALDTKTTRLTAMVGSDTANSNGWYKFASWTASDYGDLNVVFAVTSTYSRYYTGILSIQLRSDKTSVQIPQLGWLVRQGFSSTDVIGVVSGMTITLYANQQTTQYGRLLFEAISQSSINNTTSGITLYNTTTKETTAPTATKTASDIGTANYANSSGSASYLKLSTDATTDKARPIIFQSSGLSTSALTAVYDNDFKYNPVSNVLTVGSISSANVVKSLSLANNKITVTAGNGTTSTLTLPDSSIKWHSLTELSS